MKKPQIKILLMVLAVLLGLLLLKLLFDKLLPSQEAVQALFLNAGIWAYLAYFGLGTLAVVVVPLNFSLVAITGGFVYGTWVAFLINLACKIVGTFCSFMIGKYFGSKLIPYLKRKNYNTYDHILESEHLVMVYFLMCFIPLTPSDSVAYFLGFSKMKKRVFLPITILGNTGTAFTLAYIGSGEVLSNPTFIIPYLLILGGGLYWLHRHKSSFKLF